jgi:phage gpG-like protein
VADIFSISVDDRDVQKGFDRMMSAAEKTRRFYNVMKPPVRSDIKQHGLDERGPDGPWPARDPDYVAGRTWKGRGGKSLKRRRKRAPKQMLGKLTKSIRMRATREALIISSPISWAGIHQDGGIAGRGSVIPERPFLYLSDDLVEQASSVYAAFVKSAFPKGAKASIV